MIELIEIYKTFKNDKKDVEFLKNINFRINKGELVLITGPSGSGKSTLLNLIGGLDSPSAGKIIIDGEDISSFNKNKLAEMRAKKLAFIFQSYNLLDSLNVEDNIKLVKKLTGKNIDVNSLLKDVDLEGYNKKYPHTLSGGQMQRVSIARALAKDAPILLCDEPTGALDSKTGLKIMDLLKDLSGKGKTIIMVTHNLDYKIYADKLISIKDGQIKS